VVVIGALSPTHVLSPKAVHSLSIRINETRPVHESHPRVVVLEGIDEKLVVALDVL